MPAAAFRGSLLSGATAGRLAVFSRVTLDDEGTPTMSIYTTIDTPVGELLVTGRPDPVARGGVALERVAFADGGDSTARGRRDDAVFAEVDVQVRGYFAGERTGFALDHVTGGTEFQRSVWAAVDAVPYGETVTYGELARRVGAPRERVRAVAAAVGANPLLIVRPCHRVIGANGALTGYAGGVERKQALLALEGAVEPLLL